MTEETKEALPDVVSEAIAAQVGRLKLIRKDGVTSPWVTSVFVSARKLQATQSDATIADAINAWANENADRALLVFDIHILNTFDAILFYSKEVNEEHQRVLERYGREISIKVAEMKKEDAKRAEAAQEAELKEAEELQRLAKIGRTYDERLQKLKKLPDSKVKKKLYHELEDGAVHLDKVFASLVEVVKKNDELSKFGLALADQLGFGELVRAEATAEEAK